MGGYPPPGGTGLPGTDGVLVVTPPSVGFPLNFILYMPFSILTYSSNILKANFHRMDSMLDCGTSKEPKFLRESFSFNVRSPDMKLTCFTTHPWGPSVLSKTDLNFTTHPWGPSVLSNTDTSVYISLLSEVTRHLTMVHFRVTLSKEIRENRIQVVLYNVSEHSIHLYFLTCTS